MPRRRDLANNADPLDESLRPTTLDDFDGQEEVRRHLEIILGSARQRDELTDHLLFAGAPGLGKTTLAGIVAHELGLPLITTSGPALERPGDIVGLLTGLEGSAVVFIDEIHGLKRSLEELLYPAMEDGVIDVAFGEGAQARTLRLPVRPFILVGATTQSGRVSGPLRDRFGYVGRLKPYQTDALAGIVERSAGLLEIELSHDAAMMIASRSRGTPRLANARLRRVRDYATTVHTGGTAIDEEIALAALEAFGIDELGLDPLGREILTTLIDTFRGGPVGGSTLAAAVGEAPTTLEEVYEPFLMHKGLLARTPRGRMATPLTYEHLGRPVPAGLAIEGPATPALPGLGADDADSAA